MLATWRLKVAKMLTICGASRTIYPRVWYQKRRQKRRSLAATGDFSALRGGSGRPGHGVVSSVAPAAAQRLCKSSVAVAVKPSAGRMGSRQCAQMSPAPSAPFAPFGELGELGELVPRLLEKLSFGCSEEL
jgi:hypothetical protein